MKNIRNYIQESFKIKDILNFERTEYSFFRVNIASQKDKFSHIKVSKFFLEILGNDFFINLILFNFKKKLSEIEIEILNKKGIYKYLDFDNYCISFEEDMYKHSFLFDGSLHLIEIINSIVLERERGLETSIYGDTYFYSVKNSTIINFYDDRGFDIFFFGSKVFSDISVLLKKKDIDFTIYKSKNTNEPEKSISIKTKNM